MKLFLLISPDTTLFWKPTFYLIISILCKLAKHNKVCLIMQLRSKDIIFIFISPQKFGEMVIL